MFSHAWFWRYISASVAQSGDAFSTVSRSESIATTRSTRSVVAPPTSERSPRVVMAGRRESCNIIEYALAMM
jgi:hypothetical protein